eukprot:m.97991 g.97991  ORF g.97991 m.97991 type:complete len:52 (-) comp12412_c0_seq1:1477-1632(-)
MCYIMRDPSAFLCDHLPERLRGVNCEVDSAPRVPNVPTVELVNAQRKSLST